jgi:hypothetical protein
VNKDENQQTMADLFQEVFNPTNMDGAMNSMRSTGYNNLEFLPNLIEMTICTGILIIYWSCSVAELVTMEECNRLCRWRKIGMRSS